MHCNEKTYEKEIIQTCKYIRSSRDARNLKHKKCQGGKKHLISDTMCSNENPAVI